MNSADRPALSLRDVSMLIALTAIVAFFCLQGYLSTGRLDFISPRNLSLLSIELAVTAVLALGMLLVIVPGHIDLSAGSGVGLLGGLAAMLVMNPDGLVAHLLGQHSDAVLGHGLSAPVALVVATMAGVLLYAGMGALIVHQRIPAFIITLGGLLAFKGLHWKAIASATIPVVPGGQSNLFSSLTTYYLPAWASWVLLALVVGALGAGSLRAHLGRTREARSKKAGEPAFLRVFVTGQLIALTILVTSQYRGLPLAAVILALTAAAIHVLTQHTPFGRYLYAIGGNEDAARISGVPIERVTVGAFTIMGLIVALTGFLQTAYAGSSTTTIGQLMELDAIAACVIGGTSLKGGRGSVVGVLFGALIMAALLNGMTLMAVSPENKFIARGLVLALAVWMDVTLSRRRA